jgi:cation diffusion facilitator family transporter
MSEASGLAFPAIHSHAFLSEDHQKSERKAWAVIWLCSAMMVTEIVGGWLFGSIALVADGLHMSTHAGALLLAALAYTYARKYADDPRFTFGTGKLGDLAGFTSAIILAMIALLIGYEAISRLFEPVPIHFTEAIPLLSLDLRSTSPARGCSAGASIMTMVMVIATATAIVIPAMTKTKRIGSRPMMARWSSKCSRTACHRASGCTRRVAPY